MVYSKNDFKLSSVGVGSKVNYLFELTNISTINNIYSHRCTYKSSLSTRRLYLKLTFLFQILNGSFLYHNTQLVRRNLSLNLRNSNNIQFKRPICHTNAYMNSFFPHIISIWDNLPHEIQSCSSVSSFKCRVTYVLFICLSHKQ